MMENFTKEKPEKVYFFESDIDDGDIELFM